MIVGDFSAIVKTDCETDGALHSTSRNQSGNNVDQGDIYIHVSWDS